MRGFDNDGWPMAKITGRAFEASREYCQCSNEIFIGRFIHSSVA